MILAVVDDLLFRARLESVAQATGVRLQLAADGKEALQSLNDAGVDCVMIDLNLAGGNALEIVRLLRAAASHLNIIGYCAHVQQELQQQAAEAGCTKVLARSEFVQALPALFVKAQRV